ncbi:MAG: glycosyltransferase family 2 protein [Provencibacterium sp.]|jgi:glycosyltransferase involved in cell wall biosynthesis|nr:glycosyltransferase family 2 protein [Provencibacterium sp.]
MITILLACYNGERYLREQLDSLLGQTVRDFTIAARDDGSADRTLEILLEYQRAYPAIITVESAKENGGGAKYNFWQLMSSQRDDYLMLCDQDDVWLPDKIERTLQKMKELERRFGVGTPLAIHTDLRVVDEDLRLLAPSYRERAGIDFSRLAFRFQLVQATMTGCTVMYNRALAAFFDKAPRFFVMHDWWVMLTASAFGQVGQVLEPTLLYRQHRDNAVGAEDVRSLGFRLKQLVHFREARRRMLETYLQAESFLLLYRGRLSPEQLELLETFCSIPKRRKLGRWKTARRLGVYRGGLLRSAARFLLI